MVTEILKAIFFGIVEGITEWLPISSTGHMILLNEFVKLQVSDEFYKLFEVVIQLGAILDRWDHLALFQRPQAESLLAKQERAAEAEHMAAVVQGGACGDSFRGDRAAVG